MFPSKVALQGEIATFDGMAAISKGTRPSFQKGPVNMERGSAPPGGKEHIANIEQIVYISEIAIRQCRGQRLKRRRCEPSESRP